MAVTIKIVVKDCIGCGSCAALMSDYFELDFKTSKVKIIKQPGKESEVKEAIEVCPTRAIVKEEK